MMMLRLLKIFFLSSLFNVAYSQTTTLWCEGRADGSNTRQGQYQSGTSTSVEFIDNSEYIAISDSSKLQVGAIYPYKEVQIFKDAIYWKTTIDPIFGKGLFDGSINRITGEMNTSFFVFSNTGDIIRVNAKLMCNKRVGNKF